jgi:hypothetical protein
MPVAFTPSRGLEEHQKFVEFGGYMGMSHGYDFRCERI